MSPVIEKTILHNDFGVKKLLPSLAAKLSSQTASSKFEEYASKISQLKKVEFERISLEKKHAELKEKIDFIELKKQALTGMEQFFTKPFVLEYAQGSSIHKFNASRRVFDSNVKEVPAGNFSTKASEHSFVVRHNLAAAFAGVEGFDNGDIKLPYDECIFEFRISGRHVLFIVCALENGDFSAVPFFEHENVWVIPKLIPIVKLGKVQHKANSSAPNTYFEKLAEFCWGQVRAMCILLDAGICVEHRVEKNQPQKKTINHGAMPMYSYSVVDLINRKPASKHRQNEIPAFHKRLHFVRGHWRQLSEKKTWIKWHMRGDVDLGVIEKQYSL